MSQKKRTRDLGSKGNDRSSRARTRSSDIVNVASDFKKDTNSFMHTAMLEISINLKVSGFAPGNKLYDRVKWSFTNVIPQSFPFTVLDPTGTIYCAFVCYVNASYLLSIAE